MPSSFPIRATALKQLLPRASAHGESSLVIRRTPFLRQNTCTSLTTSRTFTQSPIALKKKSRAEPEAEEKAPSKSKGKNKDSEEQKVVEDPHDFATLTDSLQHVRKRLDDDLAKLRTGGRFNPEVLENLRVKLTTETKTERLGDLAQVLPKGRNLTILVGEKEHVKPVTSAIQGSPDLNLQPQQDAHNELQLNVPIPPPTKESRDLALAAATKAGKGAHDGIKNARAAVQKRLRNMELKKTARPDDLKKASKHMETIVKKAVEDADKTVETARKSMEQA